MPDDRSEDLRYDSDADLYRLRHDWWSDGEVSITIVKAIGEILDKPASDLAPLYNKINPDGLNIIYEPTLKGELRKGSGCTTFSLDDCTVTLYWDGTIEIDPPTQP